MARAKRDDGRSAAAQQDDNGQHRHNLSVVSPLSHSVFQLSLSAAVASKCRPPYGSDERGRPFVACIHFRARAKANMPRYFRIEQAEQLLPQVRRAIEEDIQARRDYEGSEQQLQQALRRMTMLGVSIADRDSIGAERARRDESAKAFNEAIEHIHSFGCQVKDLD